jgi:hypothetical protein
MLDRLRIVEEINKSCKILFLESSFKLHPSSTNRFKITGDNTSKAINNYGSLREEVSVIKWFDDYWIYGDIRFENEDSFISVSIFQGHDNDDIKHQLFRAEWDDYNDNQNKHPQPHWHITSNQAIENTFVEIASLEDSDTFVSILKEEKLKVVDVNKFHFAMIGNWMNEETHIHPLNNETKIIKWFQGLLSHIKVQLEYVK